jgi:hypothetical protein
MVKRFWLELYLLWFKSIYYFIFFFKNKTNMSSRVSEKTNKRARTAEYDVNNPFYICVAYDELSLEQQISLPPDIKRQVMGYKERISIGMRTLPGYSDPIVVIVQNSSNPNDIQCSVHSNPPYRSPRDGLSNARSFMIPIQDSSMVRSMKLIPSDAF